MSVGNCGHPHLKKASQPRAAGGCDSSGSAKVDASPQALPGSSAEGAGGSTDVAGSSTDVALVGETRHDRRKHRDIVERQHAVTSSHLRLVRTRTGTCRCPTLAGPVTRGSSPKFSFVQPTCIWRPASMQTCWHRCGRSSMLVCILSTGTCGWRQRALATRMPSGILPLEVELAMRVLRLLGLQL